MAEVLAALHIAWKMNPDMRLTQLLWNLAGHPGDGPAPGYYNVEDDRLLVIIRSYYKTGDWPVKSNV